MLGPLEEGVKEGEEEEDGGGGGRLPPTDDAGVADGGRFCPMLDLFVDVFGPGEAEAEAEAGAAAEAEAEAEAEVGRGDFTSRALRMSSSKDNWAARSD